MDSHHYTASNTFNKHLTLQDRQTMERMVRAGRSTRTIAQALGKSIRTIQRERIRGLAPHITGAGRRHPRLRYLYCANTAQQRADICKLNRGRDLKIGPDRALLLFLEHKLLIERYSPAAALACADFQEGGFYTSICVKTLYSYIASGIFAHLSMVHLPQRGKTAHRKRKTIVRDARHLKGTSIDMRPSEIEARTTFGHWELDTVVSGVRGSGALMVLTERFTRYEIIVKIKGTRTSEVIRALDALEKRFGKKRFGLLFKTITCDNGIEFSDHTRIERSAFNARHMRTKLYFAHPYCSWERGSNENNNRLIRRWIKKGSDISQVSAKEVARIQEWINQYPRQIFNYQSARAMFEKYATCA